MEKQQLIDQAQQKLSPFETGNLIDFIQHLTLKSAMEQPLLIAVFLAFALYAFLTRSKFIMLFLFAIITIMLLVRYTLTPEMVGGELSVSSTLPFAAGGLAIGGALIYLTFIKHD